MANGGGKILGISGSLRKGSYNTALLGAAVELAPAGMTIAQHALDAIPMYNDDLRQGGMPQSVEDFCAAVRAADGLLIATPEYNYSVPGVLKNAIDWASRHPQQPFDAKPIAIMGASMGRLGTARAQYHLRQIFVFLNGQLLNRPEVMVGGAKAMFDDAGTLTDEPTREILGQMLEGFAAFIKRWG